MEDMSAFGAFIPSDAINENFFSALSRKLRCCFGVSSRDDDNNQPRPYPSNDNDNESFDGSDDDSDGEPVDDSDMPTALATVYVDDSDDEPTPPWYQRAYGHAQDFYRRNSTCTIAAAMFGVLCVFVGGSIGMCFAFPALCVPQLGGAVGTGFAIGSGLFSVLGITRGA